MSKCCGMNMYVVWDLKVPFYIIPGLVISKKLFPFLIVFLIAVVLLANHISSLIKNKYVVDCVHFLCSWILMMSMMTCNGFILIAMLAGILASRCVLQKQGKERTFSCC